MAIDLKSKSIQVGKFLIKMRTWTFPSFQIRDTLKVSKWESTDNRIAIPVSVAVYIL